MAIGDTAVDVPMIQWAEAGIAAGDAAQDVREAADLVFAACTDDAVAEAIEAVLLRG